MMATGALVRREHISIHSNFTEYVPSSQNIFAFHMTFHEDAIRRKIERERRERRGGEA